MTAQATEDKQAGAKPNPPPIVIIAGNKGGIGKSLLSLATVEQQRAAGTPTAIVETDVGTPDVHKCLDDDRCPELELLVADLGSANGWIEVANFADQHPQHCLVLNTAAGANALIRDYGQILVETARELGRELVTLFIINRQRWSVEALIEYLDLMPNTRVHVVRNAYFGDEPKFQLYNSSQVRKRVESSGGVSLTFPDLADRVTDELATKYLSISRGMCRASQRLPTGDRLALSKWWREVDGVLGQVL